ncbi:hypothetical protein QJS10_CPB04g00195 [Acorus calamus]|uniref:Amidohydrolase-related domain-containing protein n=1 Tax=Acorus calamus TaxID=4465 RepID=A0AAV9F3R4_ACOCL|nr:hypothetical protein QJS10_CPB04g00195 [Acorus calamus]
MAGTLRPLTSLRPLTRFPAISTPYNLQHQRTKANMAKETRIVSPPYKTVDSHLHIWASPEEAANKYPYSPGHEPTISGHVDFLLQCMEEAGVDGALIVQPINHMFDHSLVASVLKKYPSKFVGCCLANPAQDGTGIKQLEHLVQKDGFRAVRFNPYLWPSGEKGLSLHFSEIEELSSEFPSTVVILDHLGFCKPPLNGEEREAFSQLLKLSSFPQIYVKFSALFRLSRKPYPYEDLSDLLSQVISSYSARRIMWGSDFPFVIHECGYKKAKEAVLHIASQLSVSASDLEWIMGRTVKQLFEDS